MGKFTGRWSFPHSMDGWINKTWKSMMKGSIKLYACSNGFFSFLFKLKENKDVVFGNGPYFFRSISGL